MPWACVSSSAPIFNEGCSPRCVTISPASFACVETGGRFAAPAIPIVMLQILWQARTGQTIGKRIMGIRVVRTTLNPCGLVRCLIRELFLLLDSTWLLSCVPGVCFILSTRNSQRIGDLLADTIVISDQRMSMS